MIKLMVVDTRENAPYPEVDNPMRSKLRGLKTIGGTRLAGQFPDLTLTLSDGYEVPTGLVDYFTVGLLRVVSSKLKLTLEAAEAELEYFPVRVLYKNEPTKIEYFVANPLKRIAAIDTDNSQIIFDEEIGDALSIKRMVVDESKFKGINLAVVAETHHLGVQLEVANAVELSGCIGCMFVDPSIVRK